MPSPKFPFSLTPKFRIIQKLVKDPLSSIKAWCHDKKKTITTDPVKRKKKVTKELKLNGNNLQKVATLLGKKIDEVVDAVNTIEQLEKMVLAEIKQRQQEIIRTEKGYKQGDLTERQYIQLQFNKLKTQIDLEEQNRKREDQKLETKLTQLINNVETKLTRAMKSHETVQNLETKQMTAKHDEDIKAAAEKLKEHKFKRLPAGIGTSPVHNIGHSPPSYYKKGGKLSEKDQSKSVSKLKQLKKQKLQPKSVSKLRQIKSKLPRSRNCPASEAYWDGAIGNWIGTPLCIEWHNNGDGTHTLSMENSIPISGVQIEINQIIAQNGIQDNSGLGTTLGEGGNLLLGFVTTGSSISPGTHNNLYTITTGDDSDICVTPMSYGGFDPSNVGTAECGFQTCDWSNADNPVFSNSAGDDAPGYVLSNGTCDIAHPCGCGHYDWYYSAENYISCNYNTDWVCYMESTCEYEDENYDCEGNCTAEEDCAGECGGTAIVDECGDCGGNNQAMDDCGVCYGNNDCAGCDCDSMCSNYGNYGGWQDWGTCGDGSCDDDEQPRIRYKYRTCDAPCDCGDDCSCTINEYGCYTGECGSSPPEGDASVCDDFCGHHPMDSSISLMCGGGCNNSTGTWWCSCGEWDDDPIGQGDPNNEQGATGPTVICSGNMADAQNTGITC